MLPVEQAKAELAGDPPSEEGLHLRVGDRLRAARERLGISRTELSLRTKINERHLEALEQSDFAVLPARIYAVGFARSYAGAVGLDAGRIAAEVRRELNEGENPPLRQPNQVHNDDPSKIPSTRLVWIALVLGALLIIAGTVFWRSFYVPAVELPAVSEAALREDAAAGPPELSPQAQISPTAESRVGLPAIGPDAATTATAGTGGAAPVGASGAAGPSSAPAPRTIAPQTIAPRTSTSRTITGGTALPPGTQALPSPVPNSLEPAVP